MIDDEGWDDPYPDHAYGDADVACASARLTRAHELGIDLPMYGPTGYRAFYATLKDLGHALKVDMLRTVRDVVEELPLVDAVPADDLTPVGVRTDGTLMAFGPDGKMVPAGSGDRITFASGGAGGTSISSAGIYASGGGGTYTHSYPVTTDTFTTAAPYTGTFTTGTLTTSTGSPWISPGGSAWTTPDGSLQSVIVDARGEFTVDVSQFIDRMEWETTLGPGSPKVKIWLRAGASVAIHRDPKALVFRDETEYDAIALPFDDDDYDPEDGSEL